MKNKSFFTQRFICTLIALGSILLSFSTAHATDGYPDFFFGGPTVSSVNLYQTSSDGSLLVDQHNNLIPNVITIILANIMDRGPLFSSPSGSNGLIFTLPQTIWTLSVPPNLAFSATTPPLILKIDYDKSAALGLISYYSFQCSFDVLQAGQYELRVTSAKNSSFPGSITDGSDSVAYTMTINVVDNSPPATPAPQVTKASSNK